MVRLLASLLLTAIVLSAPVPFALAGAKTAQQAKPFLPPTASMNGFLSEDDLQWVEPTKSELTPTAETSLEAVTLTSFQQAEQQNNSTTSGANSGLNGVALNGPVKRLEGHVDVKSGEITEGKAPTAVAGQNATPEAILARAQQRFQEEELKALWEATVDRNPVIRFSLEKLALPTELHKPHSSMFLNKTLSTLVSGAAMAATLTGAGNAYTQMGIMAGGQAIDNIMSGRTGPHADERKLTPTEQIQLAGLVDTLKRDLLSSYSAYSTCLDRLDSLHQETVNANALYAQELSEVGETDNPVELVTAASAYYQASLAEHTVRHQAKLARLSLERLAGPNAVKSLHMNLPPRQLASIQGVDAPPAIQAMAVSASAVSTAKPAKPAERKASPDEFEQTMPQLSFQPDSVVEKSGRQQPPNPQLAYLKATGNGKAKPDPRTVRKSEAKALNDMAFSLVRPASR